MEPAVLSPVEIRDLATLLYAALRAPAPRAATTPRPDRVRALIRRAQAVRRARVVSLAVPRRRAG